MQGCSQEVYLYCDLSNSLMLPQWTVVTPSYSSTTLGLFSTWRQNDGICVSPIVDRYLVSLERITHVLKTYIEN
jgi:hypothetical protein